MVPMVLEQTSRGSQYMDLYSRLLKDRILFLSNEITDQVANIVIAQLLFLDCENPGADIHMYINSGGGSCVAGNAIIDCMGIIRSKTITYGIGSIASMASLIAACGHKRYLLPNTRTMIHSVSSGVARSTIHDMKISYEEAQKMNEKLMQTYVDHNTKGKTIEDFMRDTQRDYYMSSQEAIDYGLADEIITKLPSK